MASALGTLHNHARGTSGTVHAGKARRRRRKSFLHDEHESITSGGHVTQQYPYYKAEYIWVDGTQPVAKLRSKAKVVPMGEEPPIWGFDGSSTQQATGDRSDCVLKPVFICDDPLRGTPHK